MVGPSDCHPDVIGWLCPLERSAIAEACADWPILIGLSTVTLIDEVVAEGAVGGSLPQAVIAAVRPTIRSTRNELKNVEAICEVIGHLLAVRLCYLARHSGT
jgi:hypothetical protein